MPSFYLETSVWGSLARRQPRDRKQVVRRLLSLLDGVRGKCVISVVVLAEIRAAPVDERDMLGQQIGRVKPVVHPISAQIESLARAYVVAGVLPQRRESDAMHVATATVVQSDYLVSWNHRHMTRPMKRLQYESVNRLHGYLKTPLICNPFEACNELQHR